MAKYGKKPNVAVKSKKAQREEKLMKYVGYPILAVMALLVIGVFVIRLSGGFLPKYAVNQFRGNLVGVSSNWLVSKSDTDGYYYHMANYNAPVGYVNHPELCLTNEDGKQQSFHFVTENEEELVQNIAVIHELSSTAEQMQQRRAAVIGEDAQTGTFQINQFTFHYAYQTSNEITADGAADETLARAYLYLYIDAPNDSCISLTLISRRMAPDQLPACDEMVTRLQDADQDLKLVAGLAIAQ